MNGRLAGLSIALVLALPGCVGGGEKARETYLQEAFRDVAGDPATDEVSLATGRRAEAGAQKLSTKEELTLPDCLRLALVHSEDLKIRGERILQADALKAQAIGGLLPSVTAYGRFTRDSDRIKFGGQTFTSLQRTEFWIGAKQPILDGRLLPAIDLAKETRRIESLRLRDDRDQLFFQVATAFYEARSLEEDSAAIEASRARSQEHLRVLQVREEAGEARREETLLARARLDEAEARGIQAGSDLERVRVRLALLTGVTPFTQRLQDTYEVLIQPGELPQLVVRALQGRRDLEIARLEVDRARSARGLVLSEYLPKATLGFDHWTDMDGGFNEMIDWTLSIDVEWAIFDGGAREAALARQLSIIRERKLERRRLQKEVRQEVEDAALAFRSLDRSMKSFESRARASAESGGLMEKRFRAGEATTLDLLVAEEVRQDAERNLARSRFARKLAALRIRLALGDLRSVLGEEK